ncbi:rod shape-determining protein MreC [Desulfococcaceae bacterium OttesenSCG-928-F15]|nr:rod shape-determining protein MreC [Desulfococcaceae bacterium OttesenSCG-928-F15]
MFSRNVFLLTIVCVLLVATFVSLALSSRRSLPDSSPSSVFSLPLVGPLQQGTQKFLSTISSIWQAYFFSVRKAREAEDLRAALAEAKQKENYYEELAMANERLRHFLNFAEDDMGDVLVAEIVGKDPSPWFKSFVINRGSSDGVRIGLPVVAPEGIVGQIVDVTGRYSKVLLMTDRMSGIDALVQRTRSRGVVNGEGGPVCSFSYILRLHDIEKDDIVVSSGLDRVYPKGLRIGRVESLERKNEGLFQNVAIHPFVDFDRIEEVMILLSPKTGDPFPSEDGGER